MSKIDWSGLGRAYLFFWYFPGITHVLLLATGATGILPLRQGIIFSLLWLIPLLLFPKHTRAIAAVIGLPLWLLSLVNLGYFAIYGQEFSQSVLFIIFESNPEEGNEYVQQYLSWWMIPAAAAHSAIAVWLWRRVRSVEMRPQYNRVTVLLIVIALLAPATTKVVRKRGVNMEALSDAFASRLEPVIPWQFAISFARYSSELAEMKALLEDFQKIPPVANLADRNAGQPATLVMVIGESTNRQHMSLYGYARETSPRLENLRDQLTIFDQVYASRPYTIEALQQALTFADQENPNLYLNKPSLMAIMKQAGYKTYWITNQQTLTKRNTMLTNFSEQMDEQVYLNHQRSQNSYSFDGTVMEPLRRILDDSETRRFIVVHLLGAHISYKYRYPPEFNVFTDRAGLPAWATDTHVQMINEYDNAILYNDHVVSEIVGLLSGMHSNALMLYFADHGEDVYDWPPHDFIGRNEAKPTPPMYAIPFMLWFSDEWKRRDPRDFAAFRQRPYQISHLIHTWSDLVGLRFDEFDPGKSLVSQNFVERPLLVGDPANQKTLVDLRTLLNPPVASMNTRAH